MIAPAPASAKAKFAMVPVGIAIASLLAIANVTVSGAWAAGDAPKVCAGEDSGLQLPKGFCATIFADEIGHARQIAVSKDGTVYVNTWSGVYYGNAKPIDGGFIVALKDTQGTGTADKNVRFGRSFSDGGSGGYGHLDLQELALRREQRRDRAL